MQLFAEEGLLRHPSVSLLKPKPVTKQTLLRVHSKEYVDHIFELARTSQPYDVETPVSPTILEAARLMVGGALEAGVAVSEGKVDRAVALGCGFHHAGRSYGGGFCLFNDVAVLVEQLRLQYGLKRALILDYDVHFGNGTSDIYYADPSVLYISLHQDPRTIYPGTGFHDQIGRDEGKGLNVNIPLPPGTGNQTYLYALQEIFVPLAKEFKPDFIIANGGSDAHYADTLGSLRLTEDGFFRLSQIITDVAELVCENRLVLMPGSGYNPTVLPSCWFALSAGVIGLHAIKQTNSSYHQVEADHVRRAAESMLSGLKQILKEYWHCFR
jgi:acetoin utilization protein AcuC